MNMIINGVVFKVITRNSHKADCILDKPYAYNDIYDAYNKPSQRKVYIWEWWKKWANKCDFSIWITSRNTSFFSIGFHGFIEGNEVYGYVTSTRNEVVIV